MPRIHTIALVLLASGSCLSASAQQPAGGGGRALDANLSATQGRYNDPVKDLQALNRFNQAIANGNAGFGKNLRVPTATSGFDNFRGSLSTSEFYRFNRDSSSGAQVSAGLSGTDALRYQFAISSGGAVPYRVGDVFAVAPQGNISTGSAVSNLRSVAAYEANSTRMGTVLGYINSPSDRYAVVASPLQGVTAVRMGDATGDRAGMVSGLENSVRGVDRPADYMKFDREKSPTMIDTRVKSGTGFDSVLDAYKAATGNGVTDPTKPANSPENKPEVKPTDKPGDKPSDPLRGPTSVDKVVGPGVKTGLEPRSDAIDPMDSLRERLAKATERLNKAREDRERQSATEAAARASAEAAKKKAANSNASAEPESPSKSAADREADRMRERDVENRKREQTRQALASLQKMDARVESYILPGQGDTTKFFELMRSGEANLAKGYYFEAESLFLHAQTYRINDPMAQVGMVHARIGAGLMVSAAGGLEATLRASPELIPVRYGDKVMPPRERIDKLGAELLIECAKPDGIGGPEAGLLLAYLGYHTNNRAWLDTGLSTMRTRLAPDNQSGQTLLEAVSTVWRAKMAAPAGGEAKP
jgi:hypothetical protein